MHSLAEFCLFELDFDLVCLLLQATCAFDRIIFVAIDVHAIEIQYIYRFFLLEKNKAF